MNCGGAIAHLNLRAAGNGGSHFLFQIGDYHETDFRGGACRCLFVYRFRPVLRRL